VHCSNGIISLGTGWDAGSTSSGELQAALLINWLSKTKKKAVASLHNFRCILISRESSLHDRFQT